MTRVPKWVTSGIARVCSSEALPWSLQCDCPGCINGRALAANILDGVADDIAGFEGNPNIVGQDPAAELQHRYYTIAAQLRHQVEGHE